jgi:predicted O-methyltransferase YrrM
MIKARSTVKSLQGLKDLCKYIGKTKEMTIIEIGSFAGESTKIFSDYFKYVYCVDSWSLENADKVLKPFIKQAECEFNILMANRGNIFKLKGNSLDVEKKVNEKFDVIYIDGSHDYKSVKADILAWKPHITKFISGHDYRKNKFPGVIKAVNEVLGKPDKVFCDFSWVKKI